MTRRRVNKRQDGNVSQEDTSIVEKLDDSCVALSKEFIHLDNSTSAAYCASHLHIINEIRGHIILTDEFYITHTTGTDVC